MTAPRAWAHYTRCNECGASSGTRCYDDDDNPRPTACRLRKLRVSKVLPTSVTINDMRLLLTDRNEQVKNLSAEIVRLRDLLAAIHAMSKGST